MLITDKILKDCPASAKQSFKKMYLIKTINNYLGVHTTFHTNSSFCINV